jgi:hypothetical protein
VHIRPVIRGSVTTRVDEIDGRAHDWTL